MLDFQNIIINKGNTNFQWKSFNQKYMQQMNIYYEILVMFLQGLFSFFFFWEQIKEYFVSGPPLIYISLTANTF